MSYIKNKNIYFLNNAIMARIFLMGKDYFFFSSSLCELSLLSW